MALVKIEFKGKTIVVANFSGKQGQALIDLMKKLDQDIIDEGKKQRILMDFRSTVMTKEVVAQQRESTVQVKNYLEKLALIGMTGIQSIIAKTIMMLVDSDIRMFSTKEEAMDWLAKD